LRQGRGPRSAPPGLTGAKLRSPRIMGCLNRREDSEPAPVDSQPDWNARDHGNATAAVTCRPWGQKDPGNHRRGLGTKVCRGNLRPWQLPFQIPRWMWRVPAVTRVHCHGRTRDQGWLALGPGRRRRGALGRSGPAGVRKAQGDRDAACGPLTGAAPRARPPLKGQDKASRARS